MSKIIGKCLGEYIKEEDIFYDPQKDVYRIKAGNKVVEVPCHCLQSESIKTLQEALSNVDDENIRIDMLGSWAKARSNPTYIDPSSVYIDTRVPYTVSGAASGPASGTATMTPETAAEIAERTAAERIAAARQATAKSSVVGASWGSWSQDPLRARVGAGVASTQSAAADDGWGVRAASQNIFSQAVGTASHTSRPWEDPLSHRPETVACCDLPEFRPDLNTNGQVQVYYHDRLPSIPIRAIIDDAIEILNKHKNLHISKIDFHVEKFGDGEVILAFSADHLRNPGLRKVLEVIFPQKAFERFTHDIDKYAKLKAKWDTNTYIKMRIAYLLLQAVKLNDRDARTVHLDIFRIFASDTKPNFYI